MSIIRQWLRLANAWLKKAAGPKHKIFPQLSLFGIKAIVLFPFILYASREDRNDPCTVQHEMVHWKQIRRVALLLSPVAPIAPILAVAGWYVAYLLIYLTQWVCASRKGHAVHIDEHLLEREAYKQEWRCRGYA